MYLFPKAKTLLLICFFLYLVLGVLSGLFLPLYVTIPFAILGVIAVFAVGLLADQKQQKAVLAILNDDQNPKAFLYTIAPILKEAVTVDKGLFTWKGLEAVALQLMGKKEEALSIRRYLLTLSVPKHELCAQNLLKGALALDLWEEGKKEEALRFKEQMDAFFAENPAIGPVDQGLREIRCLWVYQETGDSSLCIEHYRTVLSQPNATPLEITLSHFALGSILQKEKQYEQGRHHLECVIERAPQLFAAQKAKELLESPHEP